MSAPPGPVRAARRLDPLAAQSRMHRPDCLLPTQTAAQSVQAPCYQQSQPSPFTVGQHWPTLPRTACPFPRVRARFSRVSGTHGPACACGGGCELNFCPGFLPRIALLPSRLHVLTGRSSHKAAGMSQDICPAPIPSPRPPAPLPTPVLFALPALHHVAAQDTGARRPRGRKAIHAAGRVHRRGLAGPRAGPRRLQGGRNLVSWGTRRGRAG